MVFDHAVNAGPDRAGRALQLACGHRRAEVDGAVGPDTLGRVALADRLTLIEALTAMQRTGYRQMAAFGLFGEGWLARLDRRRATALTLMAMDEPISRR
jgi:lysozyme family protein